MHQHGYVHHVDTTADIDVSQHYQAFAQFKGGFLGQVRFPVRS